MSQITIADNIQFELEAIDQAQEKSEAKKEVLRKFVLSGSAFIKDFLECDRLLSEFADSLTSLVEAVGKTFEAEGKLGIPQTAFGINGGERFSKLEEKDFTATRAAVIVAAIVGTVLICYWMKAPWTIAFGGVVGFVCLGFLDKIVNVIRSALVKEESMKPENLTALTGMISESISFMRNEHSKVYFRAKFKTPDSARISRLNPQTDKALVDYRTYALETLPRIFMNRIDAISVECNRAAVARKMVLYSYWRNNPQQNSQPVNNQGNNQ